MKAVFLDFATLGPNLDVSGLHDCFPDIEIFEVTDASQVADGWHIDDVIFEGLSLAPPGAIFLDGFENGDTSAWSSTGQ